MVNGPAPFITKNNMGLTVGKPKPINKKQPLKIVLHTNRLPFLFMHYPAQNISLFFFLHTSDGSFFILLMAHSPVI